MYHSDTMGLWGRLSRWFYNSFLSPKGGEEMPVYYKCKVCEDEHPSPIPIDDKRAFESSTMMTICFRCPVKGESAIYDKEDMFWKD